MEITVPHHSIPESEVHRRFCRTWSRICNKISKFIHLLSNAPRSQFRPKILKQSLLNKSFLKFLEKHQRTTATNPILSYRSLRSYRSTVLRTPPSSLYRYHNMKWNVRNTCSIWNFTNFQQIIDRCNGGQSILVISQIFK